MDDNKTSVSEYRTRAVLQGYYEVAGPYCQFWSPNFNMHLGVWRRGINPLFREKMLEQMTLIEFPTMR